MTDTRTFDEVPLANQLKTAKWIMSDVFELLEALSFVMHRLNAGAQYMTDDDKRGLRELKGNLLRLQRQFEQTKSVVNG